jgi:hypothetical protein
MPFLFIDALAPFGIDGTTGGGGPDASEGADALEADALAGLSMAGADGLGGGAAT